MGNRRKFLKTAALAALAPARPSLAQAMQGVTATEIKIGNTMPYSGPASAYGVVGREHAAFFRMINDRGGINGRRINFISLDDGYSPPRTLEQTRRLVEEEGVAFMFQGLGTAAQTAVRPYLNAEGVPQLFVSTGADKWGDPEHYRWTMGFQPSYRLESAIYGKYILRQKPDAKIGILYQDDDFGRGYLIGLRESLGERYGTMVVKEVSYEATDPTIDSQVITLQSSGVDVAITAALPKFTAQMIRKLADLKWKPVDIISYVSASIGSVLVPAGLENAAGVTSITCVKDNSDPQWANDPGMNEWRAFMKAYLLHGNLLDANYPGTYGIALALMQVLKQCGDDLSRESIMRQAANLHDLELPTFLPGIKANTSPTNYHSIRSMQMMRFNGKSWELFGAVISA
ncbi:MAG TPA: ABC transporter substrate-binding protein [Acetobacteraceae bacterium]|nr:ABC transporter substrate-binding protein [Acetobacteraceae bacterium]